MAVGTEKNVGDSNGPTGVTHIPQSIWTHSHSLDSNGGGTVEGWNRNAENICGSKECWN